MVIYSKKPIKFLISLFIFSIGIYPSASWAEVKSQQNTSPKKWFAIWKAKNPKVKTRPLTSALIVNKSEDGTYLPEPLVTSDSDIPLFMSFTPADEIALETELNQIGDEQICNKSLINLSKCYRVNLILETSQKKWRLLSVSESGSKESILAQSKIPSDKNQRAWLNRVLNYQGIILDQNDDLLLAIIPDHPNSDESQGLILENSADKTVIGKKTSKGSGLISLVSREGRLGIFKIILDGNSENTVKIAPLTKIILEQKKLETPPPASEEKETQE